MCAEANMPLHYHTNNLTPLSTVTFPNTCIKYGITALFTQQLERVLFQ